MLKENWKSALVAAIAVTLLPLSTWAQDVETVMRRLTEQGHLYAALGVDPKSARECDVLVGEYFINKSGTAARINQWLQTHPTAPQYDRNRLGVLLANLLVREGDYGQALQIYETHALYSLPETETTEARLSQAVAYIRTRRTQAAASVLESLDEAKTHQVDILYLSGYVKYAEGDYRRAIPFLEAVQESPDYRRSASVYLADCYLCSEHPNVALQLARAYQQDFPQSSLLPDALRIEGEALYDQKQYHAATTKLQTYIASTESPQRKALYKLGMSLYQQGNFAQAAKTFSQSAGSERDAMAQNAWLHSGLCYLQTGQKQQAGIAFQQASEIEGDAAVQEEALYNYALTLHDGATMGFGENVQVFEQFLNQFPQSQYRNSVARHLTEVYFTTKNYPAALASINKIQKPSREILAAKQKVLYNLGVQAYHQGDMQVTKEYMRQSYATSPQAEPLLWKGEAEYRLGEYAAAAADLKKYLGEKGALPSNQSKAHYLLGYTYFKQKNYAAAATQFERCDQTGTTGADALNRLADCQFAARNYDAAYSTYDQARRADPTHGDYSLLQQALISGLRGNYNQKLRLLQQVGTSYQSSSLAAEALYEQGRAYVQAGDNERATTAFRRLAEDYPESPLARKVQNELGMIYSNEGNTNMAIKCYREAIELYPNTEEAQTAVANLRDLLSATGRIDELQALAQQAGQPLSQEELDKVTADAAIQAQHNGQHDQALTLYRRLEAQTSSPTILQQALNGQLASAKQLNNRATLIDVTTHLLDPTTRTSSELMLQARLLRAQSYLAAGRADSAVADYQQLTQAAQTLEGAQATVELAQYAYDTKQYESAEAILTKFTDTGTPHAYWLARGFVLLSDVYAATGRSIEARQYLLSLRSNYTESEEINRMIEQRLKSLKQ